MPVPLPSSDDLHALDRIAALCRAASNAKGFGDEGDRLRAEAAVDPTDSTYAAAQANLAAYYGNRLMLIVGEVAEAHEEIRAGHQVNDIYYSGPSVAHPVYGPVPGKPEGVPSEIADIIIRAFDFAQEAGIDLATVIEEKLAYNATRTLRHGGKAF
jgi:NTP pyrophosphatase (non-canonical NTP hydrolase)